MSVKAQRGRTRRTYSASFKAELVERCRQIGISSAAVAVSHGMNPNVLRRWIKESAESTGLAGTERPPVKIQCSPAFVELAMPERIAQHTVPSDDRIHIELQRNGTTVSVAWPLSQIAQSAAWLREVLQ
ncbi:MULTISPECIES: transposase [Alcaligenaceae]|uniref:Transposase n=2 Tax=Alcaligenaceae TaxID=506 RepID=A9IBF3_BORPD|nr:transposase [Achromobacter xylosoxidans]CAP41426.1 transposase [Bordetella petrii]